MHIRTSTQTHTSLLFEDHCVNTSNRNVENAFRRKHKSQRMSYKPMIKKTGPHAVVPASLMQQSVVDRWETAQLALGEAHSQNVHLQRQLQECRAELRTVQRQCKLQSARLNKAIGQEADLPRIVDRLTADVRSLQIRLREKTTQCETSQRKVNELQHRILVLEKECGEKQNVILPDDIALRKQANKMEEVLAELDREKKKVAVSCFCRSATPTRFGQKKQKHQLALANDQVRELRRVCQDLEFQLAERTQALQEKTKLLELQNIYSQRLPKYIPTHLPPPEVSAGLDPSEQSSLRERGRHGTKLERSIHPILGDRGSRKMKITLPFERPTSRPPHSHNNPAVSVPEVVCTQVVAERSDINLCPNEMAFGEAENRVVDASSDLNPGLPTTTFAQIPPEQVQQDENSLSTQTERNEAVQHQLGLAKKSQKHQLALANDQVRELRRVCQDLEFQLAERTQALQEKTKLLELQNIYSQRLPKYIPTHLPPPEVSAGLDPSEQSSLRERGRHGTKLERSIHPILGDRGSRKMKITLPFERPTSRPPHSHNNPAVSVPEVVCTQVVAERSDINLCPNEMAFGEAENRVVDASSDLNPGLPTTTFAQIPPEQVQQDENSLSTQTERNEVSVQDASNTCTTEHVSSPKLLQETGDQETVPNQTSQHSVSF
ncbi:hypothetical protein AHF37_07915 [Paragonimus kellicotti]|nr:hypothetical protein AHF37_07915 [Paragonimus kellicotti]